MSLSNLSSGYNLSLDGLQTISADYIYLNGQDITSTISNNYIPYSGAVQDIDINNKNINNVNTITSTTLNSTTTNLKNGNTASGATLNQLTLGYNNTLTYRHAVKTRHNSGADDTGNAIDFYIWKVADTLNVIGSKQVLSITSAGVGIYKTNPSYSLDVVGTANVSGLISGSSGVNFTCPSSNTPFFSIPDNFGQVVLFGSSTGKQFYTELKNTPTEHIRMGYYNGAGKTIVINDTASGNVIIGNHNNIFNNYRLDVNGDINTRANMYIETALYTNAINSRSITLNINGSNTQSTTIGNGTGTLSLLGSVINTSSINASANKITSTYVAVNNEDLINLLYLTNNYYNKTSTTTLLNAKANLSGATFTGPIDMGVNKITSSYVPINNADLTNLLYLINNYYTKTQIDTTFTSYYTKTQIDTALTNYYTKTQIDTTFTNYYNKTSTDTLLNAKASLSGATFTGAVDMGINKITSSYSPINNEDLPNYGYLLNNYYKVFEVDYIADAKLSNSGGTMTGSIDMGTNKITSSYVPINNADLTNLLYITGNYYNKTSIDSTFSNYYNKTSIDSTLTNYYNKTSTDSLLNAKLNLSGGTITGAITSNSNITTTGKFSGNLNAGNNRAVKPSDLSASSLAYHFGSFNNDNGASGIWSDCLHFNSWSDSSGGEQNVLMLRKSGNPGIRIYKNSFGSTSAYSTYADALMVDSSNNLLNTVTASTSNTKFLTLSSSNKIEYNNYGVGFYIIFAVNQTYANWGAGLLKNSAFTTSKNMQIIMFSGNYSGYSTSTGNTQVNIRINLSGTTTYEYLTIKNYSNVTSSHFQVPINIAYQITTAGTYDVYMYIVTNFTTDSNDVCYLNAAVLF